MPAGYMAELDRPPRPSWDDTFFTLATVWAQRATCPRLSTGAVIVTPDRHVIASGYNGAVRGEPHCLDAGCLIVANHCERAVHAEMNAILQAARIGVSIRGCTLYALHIPCNRCTRLALQAGISEVVFQRYYPIPPSPEHMERWQAVASLCREAGVTLRQAGGGRHATA